MTELIASLLAITLRSGTSLIYATIGEIYTERSGILNLGVEGMMLMSALTSFATVYYTGNLFLSILVAMLVGGTLASLHAFLSVSMRANQVVSGLSITLFGSGMASFLGQRLGPESNSGYLVGLVGSKFEPISIPLLRKLPGIGAIFNQDILTYIVYLLLPLSWFYLYKTRNGLNLRSVGENPQTADAMGIDVGKVRYMYTICGIRQGLFGALFFSAASMPCSSGCRHPEQQFRPLI
jgi:simple sugar transport system permease protein